MSVIHTYGLPQADAVVAVLRLSGYHAYWCLHRRGGYAIHYRER